MSQDIDTFDDRERCATCYYRGDGDCHRYPPQPFPMPSQNTITGQAEVMTLGLFPPAGEKSWCGEWKARASN